MSELPPFYVGESVVVVKSFKKLRKVWGFSYPEKGSIVIIQTIRKHPIHDFWLVTIPICECEICHKCFAPLQGEFKTISFDKIINQERKLVCAN